MKELSSIYNKPRVNPKIWQYSYILAKSNLNTFKQFRDLVVHEKKASILDVGCGFKPWRGFFKDSFEYVGVDYSKENSFADLVASADALPFPDHYFDTLVYSEVLEHVDNLAETIREMRRVAKNDALVFISSPFMFPEHGIPYDYQRLTEFYYRNVFKTEEIVVLKPSNSSFSTGIFSFNTAIESSPLRRLVGIKQMIYLFANVCALAVEFIFSLLVLTLFKRFRKSFYMMPLGYSVIVRIKK